MRVRGERRQDDRLPPFEEPLTFVDQLNFDDDNVGQGSKYFMYDMRENFNPARFI